MSRLPPDARATELARRLGPTVRFGEPMSRHTSLRVGGPAELFLSARSHDQLVLAVEHASLLGIPWRVIGGASNLVVADAGVDGLIVKAAACGGAALLDTANTVLVRADAGCMLAAIAKQLAMQGLAGLDWAVNVPGTIGGSVVNNSGAFGSCVSEHLVEAQVFVPGQGICRMSTEELGLAYRTSRLKRGELVGVVLAATYRVVPASVEDLRARIRGVQRLRRDKQPSGFSVGSVFANPPGAYAGELIDRAGLKGSRVGDAEVSTLHANFIVNRAKARAQDVLELMALVRQRVREHTGEWLTPEVQLLGQFAPDETRGLAPVPAVAP